MNLFLILFDDVDTQIIIKYCMVHTHTHTFRVFLMCEIYVILSHVIRLKIKEIQRTLS